MSYFLYLAWPWAVGESYAVYHTPYHDVSMIESDRCKGNRDLDYKMNVSGAGLIGGARGVHAQPPLRIGLMEECR
jgi:hypothetical protein